ncbi:putative non-ribosomal peptide synthetase [Burkholderia pseudomallei MSHR4377]|nr:putative non-ribosomal peptide synthetase [Burkholderia pseudomallei MSHR4377]
MSSPASRNDSVSSNCAVCSGVSTAADRQPRYRQFPAGMFCQTNITWNSGGMRGCCAARLHPFHHLIERQVLMRLRR